MTPISLAAVEKACAAVTPGPWRADDEHGLLPGAEPAWCVSRTDKNGAYLGDVAYTNGSHEQTDAELIALSRTALPAMAAALRAVLALPGPDFRPVRHDGYTGAYRQGMDNGYLVALNDIRRAISIAGIAIGDQS